MINQRQCLHKTDLEQTKGDHEYETLLSLTIHTVNYKECNLVPEGRTCALLRNGNKMKNLEGFLTFCDGTNFSWL